MKTNYPIEAFALAMVAFTNTLQDSLISGILILFIATLGLVLYHSLERFIPEWSSKICLTILIMSITYSLFSIVMEGVLKLKPQNENIIFQLFVGALIVKFILQSDKEPDYNSLLFKGSYAFGALIIISTLREFLSTGNIYGNKIVVLEFFSMNFNDIAIGLLFSGITISILFRLFGNPTKRLNGLFVIIPVILIKQPFFIESINESLGILLSILITIFLFLSVKEYLFFSRISREFRHMPIELVSMSFIYMILAAF